MKDEGTAGHSKLVFTDVSAKKLCFVCKTYTQIGLLNDLCHLDLEMYLLRVLLSASVAQRLWYSAENDDAGSSPDRSEFLHQIAILRWFS